MTARSLVPVVAALALAGCPPRVPPPDLSLDPAALLAQVRAAQEAVPGARGEARVRLDAPGGSGTVPALVAAERPDRVYVQTLDFFGNAATVLATAAGELSLYDARERVLYRGAATAENLSRLVPVPLSPADLAAILCGSAPLLDGEPVAVEPGRGFVTLELRAGSRRQRLRVEQGAVVRSAALEVPPGERGGYEVSFSAPGTTAGVRFPGRIELSAPAAGVKLQLEWVEVEAPADVEDRLFAPEIPRGARVVDLAGAPLPPGLFPETAPAR